MNRLEVDLAEMERELQISRSNYLNYASKLEQARIDQALQTEQISNLSVLQSPTLRLTPSSPNVKINIIVGCLVAMMLAATIMLLGERRLREQADRQRGLENEHAVSEREITEGEVGAEVGAEDVEEGVEEQDEVPTRPR